MTGGGVDHNRIPPVRVGALAQRVAVETKNDLKKTGKKRKSKNGKNNREPDVRCGFDTISYDRRI
jgi:hypothetical protein